MRRTRRGQGNTTEVCDEVITMLQTRLATVTPRTRIRAPRPPHSSRAPRPATVCAVALLTTFFALAVGAGGVAAQPSPNAAAENKSAPVEIKPAQKAGELCHQPAAPQGAPVKGAAPAVAPIPDVWVVDQDGNKRRFYTDLVKGKVVAINFVFTSCTYICPMQGKNFGQLQASLGDRLGREVHLVSVSTDPATDTPARLKAWAATFGARPGWTLVTGEREEMDKLLLALTGDASGQSKHSPVAFVGDLDKGAWVRAYALAEPERYLRMFAEAAGRREPAAPAGGPPATPPRQQPPQ